MLRVSLLEYALRYSQYFPLFSTDFTPVTVWDQQEPVWINILSFFCGQLWVSCNQSIYYFLFTVCSLLRFLTSIFVS